jgi:hypothetical protein
MSTRHAQQTHSSMVSQSSREAFRPMNARCGTVDSWTPKPSPEGRAEWDQGVQLGDLCIRELDRRGLRVLADVHRVRLPASVAVTPG